MRSKKKCPEATTKAPEKDMMEAMNISPWYSVGKILPTSTKKKEDVFNSYRTNRRCVDYKISETWAKMQGGDVKINIRHTCGTYEEIPPEECKPQREKKVKCFSGGPPQWKFINELWGENMNRCQEEHKIYHEKMAHEAKTARKNRFTREHEIVQRLVGPDWFMELSPKQIEAVNKLKQSVYLDIRLRTTENCQDILATLGLVLRPSKKHIEKALRHCCGCAVEFLLVLYQLIDPRRKSYSLNDRILLSAVVHLSITQTLRELHVRIPSPPRPTKKAKKPKKKVAKVEYESPYLEPLTYEPAPPKFTGIYKNKHKQHPESPYFSYLKEYEADRRSPHYCLNFSMLRGGAERKARVAEYKEAQNFFSNLPGAENQTFNLLYPSQLHTCPNFLRPKEKITTIRKRLIAPHLCTVSPSEDVICYCEENRQKLNPDYKPIKRSCCEKNAQNFLATMCLCDDCLEEVAQKNIVRIHGGVQKSPCKCDDPVPIIQGTLLNRTCECYKEYRNKVVGAAARQYLADQEHRYVVGGVVMTKCGPVYQIVQSQGDKICICGEIKERKRVVKQIQETMWNNKAKFTIGGVTMTKFGPVFNIAAVVARAPCKCLIKYRAKLKILLIQNEVRRNRSCFVNHGLIMGKMGPVYHFSSYVAHAAKSPLELHEVCSCEIKKPKCFQTCYDYVEYKISHHTMTSTSEDSKCISEETETSTESESTESESKETTSSQQQSEGGGDGDGARPSSRRNSASKEKRSNAQSARICSNGEPQCTKSSSSELETSSGETDTSKESSSCPENSSKADECEKPTSDKSSDNDELLTPKPCSCKDELDRFMKAKCPCEECNNKMRQDTAVYVMGGSMETSSGQQVNVVQGVQQPVCACLHQHQEYIRKIDEYKSRVKARYNLKKQSHKYCICGVKNTPDGPVYIISGLRPPVDCECAKAVREKQEQEEHEKQRAKMPNTGRKKYEIAGVRAMPEENVFILSRALNMPECKCGEVLASFEGAHRNCMNELERYLELTVNEIRDLDEEIMDQEQRRGTLLNEDDINFGEQKKYFSMYGSAQPSREGSTYRVEPAKIPVSNTIMTASQAVVNPVETPNLDPITEESDAPVEIQEHQEDERSVSIEQAQDTKCACAEDSSDEEEYDSLSFEDSSSTLETTSSDVTESYSSECGSCHVQIAPDVKPIHMPKDRQFPDSFVSKRFAIFRTFPKDLKTQLQVLQHILPGMAEDGFSLAKLPQVYKLPIFKLWLQMRSEVYWTYEDRFKYFCRSKDLWKHTFACYKTPLAETIPFTFDEAHAMTWKQADFIKSLTSDKMNRFYRNVKQLTVNAGREFFAPTFSYEFPTPTWRDVAFAYLPAKEEDVFAYKIVKPHDKRQIPDNKRMNCYC